MLNTIYITLGNIGEMIEFIVDFIVQGTGAAVEAFEFILSVIVLPNYIVSFMPGFLGIAVSVFLGIYLVKFILSLLPL